MRTRLLPALTAAGAGVLATLVGVSAGHLVAAALEPASSPVLVVGSTVIDLTPTPLKEWAIAHFGTHDKDVMVGSVLAGVLVLAAVAGLLARRRFAYGAGLLLALTAIPALAALDRPEAAATDVLPSVAAAVAGLGALAWLHRAATAAATAPGAGGRRGVLVAGGTLAVGAVVMAGAGRWLTSYRTRSVVVDLPAAADPPHRSRPGWTARLRASRRSGPRSATSTGSTPASRFRSSTWTAGP